MKKTISILFVLALFLPFTGTYLWIKHKQKTIRKQIKKEIIAGIDKNELIFLKFSKNEIYSVLKWKHSKEFEYNNQMYDIVEKTLTKDSVFYLCWWDNEETQLNKQLVNAVNISIGNNKQNKEKQSDLINFYKSLYFFDFYSYNPNIFDSDNDVYTKYKLKNYCCFINNISPPPKKINIFSI